MFSIKNGINTTSFLYTESHKIFPVLCGKFLKSILLYLYFINYNEINMYHSDIQKHVSYKNSKKTSRITCTGLHKSFPILRGEIFKAYFSIFILH